MPYPDAHRSPKEEAVATTAKSVDPLPKRKASILVVDDEEDILELVRHNLTREGYQITCADSGERALEILNQSMPDLMLLDLMLPGIDGLDICRRLKGSSATAALPIILITAKTEDADIVAGLECGADDYVTKPFSPRVLLARIKAVLRNPKHAKTPAESVLQYGELVIKPSHHQVFIGIYPADLTITEYRILLTLANRPGWVFSRQQIVSAARGGNAVVTPRSVDVHIVRLRNKLGASGELIETVRGLGYRFNGERTS